VKKDSIPLSQHLSVKIIKIGLTNLERRWITFWTPRCSLSNCIPKLCTQIGPHRNGDLYSLT